MDLREVNSNMVQRHPWEVSRARFCSSLLKPFLGETQSSILDVGSGDGFFATYLAKEFNHRVDLFCWDINYSKEQLSKLSKQTPSVTFCSEPPIKQFDIVLMMDVLEHIQKDEDFLASVVQNYLKSGGILLCTVPSWNFLFSSHDVKLGHERRYSSKQLENVLNSTRSLTTLKRGGLFHSLIAPRMLTVLKEKVVRLSRSQTFANQHEREHKHEHELELDLSSWHHRRYITGAVNFALSLDNSLSYLTSSMNVQLPGLSTWALCRKK